MKKINASVCAVSHMGIVADRNEDNLFINGITPSVSELEKGFIDSRELSEPFLVGICDGEGGTKASAAGVEALKSHMDNILKSNSSCNRIFENCIITANEEICADGDSDNVSTLSAVYAYEDNIEVCLIGNSPVFHLSDGVLTRIGGNASENLKRIGVKLEGDNLVPTVLSVDGVKDGDSVIVCSTGLTGMVDEANIAEILSQCDSAKQSATLLVKTALENGGKSNISVIVMKISIEEEEIVSPLDDAVPSVLQSLMSEPITETETAVDDSENDTADDTYTYDPTSAAEGDSKEENDGNDADNGNIDIDSGRDFEPIGFAEFTPEENESYEDTAVPEATPEEEKLYSKFAKPNDIYSSSEDEYDESEEINGGKFSAIFGKKPIDLILYGVCAIFLVLCIILSISVISLKKERNDLNKELDTLKGVSSEDSESADVDSGFVIETSPNEWRVEDEWVLDIFSATRKDVNGDGETDIALNYSFTDLSQTGIVFDMRSHESSGTRVDVFKVIRGDFFESEDENVLVGESRDLKTSVNNEVYFSDDDSCTHVRVEVCLKGSDGTSRYHVFMVEIEG